MKLKYLFLSLVACLALGATAQEANVYASGLKANKIDGNSYEISFVLNAPATVVLNVGDKTFDLGECAKGENTKELVIEGVTGENLPWSLTATGAETATEPVKIGTQVFTNSRGVTIDNNMESPYFGTIYVCETKSASETGLMRFNAAFEGDGTIYGGNAGFTESAASPQRVFVAKDALYLCDWSDAHANVFRANPADLTQDFVPIFGGTQAGSGLHTADDGTAISGSISSIWVEGEGENAILYTIDEDYAGPADTKNNILQYNIGLAETPWVAAPSAVVFDNADNLIPNAKNTIIPDETGWWISQYRYTETAANPAFIHYNTVTGEVDFNSATADPAGVLVGNSQNGGMAINPAGTMLAITASNQIKVFDLVPGRGAPVVTPKYAFAHGLGGTTVWTLAFDSADNLYAANDGGKGVAFYAMPKVTNEFTTDAPAAEAITIESVTGVKDIDVKNVAKVTYVNMAGQQSNTPWQGVNVVVTSYTDGTTQSTKVVK